MFAKEFPITALKPNTVINDLYFQ